MLHSDYRQINARATQPKQKKSGDPLADLFDEKCQENQRLKNRISQLETQVLKLGGTIPRTKPERINAKDFVYDDIRIRLSR